MSEKQIVLNIRTVNCTNFNGTNLNINKVSHDYLIPLIS